MASERSLGFVKAISFTLPWETGKDKNGNLRADGGLQYQDGGLPTKYGIWKGANPTVDVENLTVETATEIYKTKYWDIYTSLRPVSANLDNLPTALAVAVFDTGVNNGVERAVGWLGSALQQKSPVRAMIDARANHDLDVAKQKGPTYPIKGLMARINDLRKYCDILEQDAQNGFNVLEKVLGRPVDHGQLS